MAFRWLKSILPKGLYGRTALILVIPIITIQLVVAVVFIQRLFDDVTRQMTRNVAIELRYVITRINQAAPRGTRAVAAAIADSATPLDMTVRALPPGAQPEGPDRKSWDDLTGGVVIDSLRADLPQIVHVDLARERRRVVLVVATDAGPHEIAFDRTRVSATNPHQLLVMMIFVALVMTLIAFLFLRNQVRPIRRLARAAEAFGKGRMMPLRIAGATEVRQATRAFLDMRERIERQVEQRTLMLSGVSHDLRTPLTRLKLALSLAEGDEARAMLADVAEMEQMLDEFLAFARGDSLEQPERVDPAELTRQAVADAAPDAERVDLVLPEGPLPAVSLRPAAIRRALGNLIGNALRYGTRCRLTLELDRAEVIWIVEDDGPGIPARDRDAALRPFVRLDAARNQNRGTGVGLGLAIAMDIASSHGGALELGDSETLGGLRAELRVPR